MSTETLTSTAGGNGARAILYGGLLAGALDLTAAVAVNAARGLEPVRLMQSISSGLLGADAYQHGSVTATLGVVLHFLMMFVICGIYYAASRRLAVLVDRPLVMGVLYGVVVYLVMNFVVLPLSAFPHQIAYTPASFSIGMSVIVLCVGLPIAYVTRRYG